MGLSLILVSLLFSGYSLVCLNFDGDGVFFPILLQFECLMVFVFSFPFCFCLVVRKILENYVIGVLNLFCPFCLKNKKDDETLVSWLFKLKIVSMNLKILFLFF